MRKKEIIKFLDGGTARLHNKKISFMQIEDRIQIIFRFADVEPNKPACYHKVLKGIVRETGLQMSVEAMDALVEAYVYYKMNP